MKYLISKKDGLLPTLFPSRKMIDIYDLSKISLQLYEICSFPVSLGYVHSEKNGIVDKTKIDVILPDTIDQRLLRRKLDKKGYRIEPLNYQ